ncbi:amino acid ABC transporter permease [Pseudoclavibacter sp. 13-3]|uniref:amino acid ABC transporter permease n=1 Tax=Pseudoclavibacter sp. 13-3 TaxID=2901228 RepID=UPI001E39E15D|nr:amino acid ABC transporter permease [Pseudoclavibacter sp. 13-3]MCD7101354.1 amino acid ABC transporter permease [Pseudoclavibacter sp. 13-3]
MGNLFSDIGYLLGKYDVVGAFWVNVQLTLWAGVLSFLFGLILVSMRVSPVPSLSRGAATYINIVRNIPLTVIILACSLGLWGQLGIELAAKDSPDFLAQNGFRLAVLGLTAYTACFMAESLRAGFNTVPVGQAEAARAIGLTFGQTMRLVILPQAIRGSIVPLGNTLIALAKNTTVVQAAGVVQAASFMITGIDQNGNMIFAVFTIVAIGWVIIVLPIGLISTFLSKRLGVAR